MMRGIFCFQFDTRHSRVRQQLIFFGSLMAYNKKTKKPTSFILASKHNTRQNTHIAVQRTPGSFFLLCCLIFLSSLMVNGMSSVGWFYDWSGLGSPWKGFRFPLAWRVRLEIIGLISLSRELGVLLCIREAVSPDFWS
jgi:hypothetical protein